MKRIIAIIIVFLLGLASFPVFTCDVYASDVNLSNMDFIKNLGIVQEEISGEELVTRAGLAKIYYSVMTGSAVPEYSSYGTKFADVTEKESGYVKVVSDAGIMNGTSETTFSPSEKVTYAQLIKTVVTFLGYKTYAEVSGGWPYGYISVASGLGFGKVAPSDINYYVTYSGVADILRLAADAKFMHRVEFEEEVYEPYDGNGYLEYYMGITLADGIITANTTISVNAGDVAPFGKVEINGKLFRISQECLGIYDFIGRNVTAFVSDKNGYDEICYFEVLKNNIYEIDAEDILSVKENRINYETDKKDDFVKFNSDVTVIYNGSVAKNYTVDTINPFFSNNLDGKIIAIDNNDDKIADIIITEAYETFVCAGFKNGIATSDIVRGKTADFNDFDDVSYNVLNAIGQPLDYTDIVAGDILNCYYTLSGVLSKVVVTIDSAKGIVDEIVADDNGIASLVISGKEFECANSLIQSPDAKDIRAGDSVTFYFNKDKKIAVIKKGAEDSEFALIVDFRKNDGLDDSYLVKLFETSGKFNVYTLAEKVSINGNKVSDGDVCATLGISQESGKIKRQMIAYSLNTEGKINSILMADSSKDAEGFYESDFFIYDGYDGSTAHSYRTELNTFGLDLYVGSASKVIVMPPEESRGLEKAYAVKNSGYFAKAGYTISAYGTNKYSRVADIIVHESSAGASADLSKTTMIFAISDIVRKIDENGDEVLCLNGFYKESDTGNFGSLNVTDESVLKVGKNGEMVEKGDIIVISKDAEGSIDAARLILDKSENQLFEMNNPNGSYPGTDQRFAYGKLLMMDATHITLEVTDTDGSIRHETYPIYRFENTGALGICDERSGDIAFSKVKTAELYDYVTYGDECSYVFTVLNGSWWISGVIYN